VLQTLKAKNSVVVRHKLFTENYESKHIHIRAREWAHELFKGKRRQNFCHPTVQHHSIDVLQVFHDLRKHPHPETNWYQNTLKIKSKKVINNLRSH
jgi:hypothetical protein